MLEQGKARAWQGKGLCSSLAVEQQEQGCVNPSASRSALG